MSMTKEQLTRVGYICRLILLRKDTYPIILGSQAIASIAMLSNCLGNARQPIDDSSALLAMRALEILATQWPLLDGSCPITREDNTLIKKFVAWGKQYV